MKENLIEMEISNQAFSKNGWRLIKKYKNSKNNFYALIKCETCGEEKLVNYYNFVDVSKKANKCINCKYMEISNSEIGKTYGTVKVLQLDHKEIRGTKCYLYFLTQCTICGKFSIRLFNTSQWSKTNGCKKCKSVFDNSSYNDLIKVYKEGAVNRNIDWNLSNEQFLNLVQENCFYCGEHPSIRKHDYSTYKTEVNGIDRLDSSKGYSIDNCVTCCTKCNYMKSNYCKHEFLEHIAKIYNYQVEKEGSETISKESTPK